MLFKSMSKRWNMDNESSDSVGCIASLLLQIWIFSPAGWNLGCCSLFSPSQSETWPCLEQGTRVRYLSSFVHHFMTPHLFFSSPSVVLFACFWSEEWGTDPLSRDFSIYHFSEKSLLISACCLAACFFLIILSIGLERLEMLDLADPGVASHGSYGCPLRHCLPWKDPRWVQGCGSASRRN